MNEEYNKIVIENSSVPEGNAEFIQPVFLERNPLAQPIEYKEKNEDTIKKPISKKRKNAIKVITSLWVIAAAAVVGVVETDTVLPILSEKVNIHVTYAERTEAHYTIDFGDYKPTGELRLFLNNDFIERELEVYYDDYYFEEFNRYNEADGGQKFVLEGYIDDLVPNMPYKLTLKDGAKTIGRTSFTSNTVRYDDNGYSEDYQVDDVVTEQDDNENNNGTR